MFLKCFQGEREGEGGHKIHGNDLGVMETVIGFMEHAKKVHERLPNGPRTVRDAVVVSCYPTAVRNVFGMCAFEEKHVKPL